MTGISLAPGTLTLVTGEEGTTELLASLADRGRLVPAEPALDADRDVLHHGDPGDPAWVTLLDRFDLTEHGTKLPRMLSRGTATRVQLAQAFWARPDTYLFDQPFNGLDRRGRELFVVLVSEALSAGACVVVATFDVEAFAGLPHEVLTLS